MRKGIFSGIFALLLATAPMYAATWNVDAAHSSVQFAVTHMMVSTVRGYFDKFEGTVTSADSGLSDLAFAATIDAASVDTREPKRDDHLRSADFFDVANFPTITFKSTKTTPVAPGKFKVTGDLTLHGVTKEVVFDVEGLNSMIRGMRGETRTAAIATTKINRKDFGLNWNKALEAGGVLVSEEVPITLEFELVRQQES